MRRHRPLTSLDRGNRQAWRLGALAAVLILALAATAGVLVKESHDSRRATQARSSITAAQEQRIECIATWANTWSRRSEQQADADRERLAALDRLARTLAHGNPALWRAAVERYLAASDRYAARIKAHPLPPAPAFVCDQITAGQLPEPSTVTVTPAPSTATATATTMAPGRPGATTTVHETVTKPARTRTVTKPGPTRTVHPSPSCVLGHLLCQGAP